MEPLTNGPPACPATLHDLLSVVSIQQTFSIENPNPIPLRQSSEARTLLVDQPRRKQTTIRPIPTPKTYSYSQTGPFNFCFDQLLQVQTRHRSTCPRTLHGPTFQEVGRLGRAARTPVVHNLSPPRTYHTRSDTSTKELRKREREG